MQMKQKQFESKVNIETLCKPTSLISIYSKQDQLSSEYYEKNQIENYQRNL